MDVMRLRRLAWTITEIADESGCHPATISSWLRNGGPPASVSGSVSARAADRAPRSSPPMSPRSPPSPPVPAPPRRGAIGGLPVEHLRGRSGITVVRGRLPAGAEELALGAATAEELDVGVGSSVVAAGPAGERELRVVGVVALPASDADDLSPGWTADRCAVDALGFGPGCNHESNCFQTTAVTWRDGADVATVACRLEAAGLEVVQPRPSPGVVLVERVDKIPRLAAGGVALVAGIGLVHTVSVTVRRRRRELAVANALGLVPRRGAGVLVSEALSLGVAGAMAGGLLGVVAGRAAWRAAAGAIGIAPALPGLAAPVAGVVVGVIALSVLTSALPAGKVLRDTPAAGLRTTGEPLPSCPRRRDSGRGCRHHCAGAPHTLATGPEAGEEGHVGRGAVGGQWIDSGAVRGSLCARHRGRTRVRRWRPRSADPRHERARHRHGAGTLRGRRAHVRADSHCGGRRGCRGGGRTRRQRPGQPRPGPGRPGHLVRRRGGPDAPRSSQSGWSASHPRALRTTGRASEADASATVSDLAGDAQHLVFGFTRAPAPHSVGYEFSVLSTMTSILTSPTGRGHRRHHRSRDGDRPPASLGRSG